MSKVTFDGQVYNVSERLARGAIDYGRLNIDGAEIRGWALDPRTNLPFKQVIIVNFEHVEPIPESSFRPDIKNSIGENAAYSGFQGHIPLNCIPQRFRLNPDVYGLSPDGLAFKVAKYHAQYEMDIDIREWEDYASKIQVPSTRIKNDELIAYASYHCFNRFNSDYVVKSGALCVIGYRLLSGDDKKIKQLANFFEDAIVEVADEVPNVSQGVYLRWHTSLRLLQGYYCLAKSDLEGAYKSFSEVRNHWHLLEKWPSAISNLLIAALFAGLIAKKIGRSELAKNEWSGAPELMLSAVGAAKTPNYYAFEEIINAVKIAREIKVGLLALPADSIENPEIGPPGRRIMLDEIGNLWHLSKEIKKLFE